MGLGVKAPVVFSSSNVVVILIYVLFLFACGGVFFCPCWGVLALSPDEERN